MTADAVRCEHCGAPLAPGAGSCRYCGTARPGAPPAPPPLPPEIMQAVERVRLRMGEGAALVGWLGSALQSALGGAAAAKRGRSLQVMLGTIHYSFAVQGGAVVVERQSVAAGMAVGMNDIVPASRWPELLVSDVARFADESGRDWRAVLARLS